MSDLMILQIPAVITEDRNIKGGGRKFVLECHDFVEPEAMQKFIAMEGQKGWFNFAIRQIEASDLLELPELMPTDEKKTPSQRMRAVMFRLWEQNAEEFKDFDSYYRYKMEKLIDYLKEKLD